LLLRALGELRSGLQLHPESVYCLFFFLVCQVLSTMILFASLSGISLYFFSLFTHAHYFLNSLRSIVVPVVVRIAARILFSHTCIVVEVLILLCFLSWRWCHMQFCGPWRDCECLQDVLLFSHLFSFRSLFRLLFSYFKLGNAVGG